jgi:hypothetical protein
MSPLALFYPKYRPQEKDFGIAVREMEYPQRISGSDMA